MVPNTAGLREARSCSVNARTKKRNSPPEKHQPGPATMLPQCAAVSEPATLMMNSPVPHSARASITQKKRRLSRTLAPRESTKKPTMRVMTVATRGSRA